MAPESITADVLLDARAETAERPVWDDRRERLVWVDVPRGEVHALDPASGRDRIEHRLDQPVGFAALRRGGGLVLGIRDGFLLDGESGGDPRLELRVDRPNQTVRMNDGLCDAEGRLWAGTLDAEGAGAALYRLERDDNRYRVDLEVAGVRESNGLDWSVDSTVLYWIDTASGRVDAFDYDLESGRARNRRPFVEIDGAEGVPDGLIVDAEGGVWVAIYGAGVVRRYDPAGTARFEVRVPARRPTCPTFGGRDLQDMYITSQRYTPDHPDYPDDDTAGDLFACRPGFTGRPARRFAG